jgi:hypothetical protein
MIICIKWLFIIFLVIKKPLLNWFQKGFYKVKQNFWHQQTRIDITTVEHTSATILICFCCCLKFFILFVLVIGYKKSLPFSAGGFAILSCKLIYAIFNPQDSSWTDFTIVHTLKFIFLCLNTKFANNYLQKQIWKRNNSKKWG